MDQAVWYLPLPPDRAGKVDPECVHRFPGVDPSTEPFQFNGPYAAQRGLVMCDELVGQEPIIGLVAFQEIVPQPDDRLRRGDLQPPAEVAPQVTNRIGSAIRQGLQRRGDLAFNRRRIEARLGQKISSSSIMFGSD